MVLFFHQDSSKTHLRPRLTTASGRIVNIEVQVERYKFFIQRIIYYLAKMLVEQMKAGFNYGRINQTICVVIANHILCPEEEHYLNSYDLRNPITGRLFTDLLKVVILELPKVPETDDNRAIWPWLQFFKCKTKEDFTMLAKTHPEVKPAINEYAKLSWSDRRRMIADYKEKARRDKYAMMEFAKDEGRDEGIALGEVKGIAIGEAKGLERLRNTARKMKIRGIPVNQIAEDTGLTLEEVEQL
ncbi:Rpn family recombination-promoting nuclease/putative transposase [Treponema primitia]|uniref:Rpn family recombination-promoting nuclease/putative transposase n=1 Tax=Treponema primitia TaxID=88058 RepID=UPI0009DAF5B7|nr:Rpn family recombination-promoting nuclease/putative transposase [Treponema primitia]